MGSLLLRIVLEAFEHLIIRIRLFCAHFKCPGATELREKPEALEAVDSAHLTFMTTEGSVPKEHLKHPRSASIFDPLGFRIDGDTDAVHHGRGVFAASVSLAFRVGSNASDSEEAVDADDAVSFTSTAPSQSGAMKSPLSWTCDEVAKWLQNLDAQYSRHCCCNISSQTIYVNILCQTRLQDLNIQRMCQM